eukprot:2998647-Rhodomonas_salina.1
MAAQIEQIVGAKDPFTLLGLPVRETDVPTVTSSYRRLEASHRPCAKRCPALTSGMALPGALRAP